MRSLLNILGPVGRDEPKIFWPPYFFVPSMPGLRKIAAFQINPFSIAMNQITLSERLGPSFPANVFELQPQQTRPALVVVFCRLSTIH